MLAEFGDWFLDHDRCWCEEFDAPAGLVGDTGDGAFHWAFDGDAWIGELDKSICDFCGPGLCLGLIGIAADDPCHACDGGEAAVLAGLEFLVREAGVVVFGGEDDR